MGLQETSCWGYSFKRTTARQNPVILGWRNRLLQLLKAPRTEFSPDICWREVWEVMLRSFQNTRDRAIPTPIWTPFESQRQLLPKLPDCFRIPIRLEMHPYMPVQVIGKLPKFITKSIQRQSILICPAIHFLLICSVLGAWLVPSWSLGIHTHIGSLRHLCLFLLIGSVDKQR